MKRIDLTGLRFGRLTVIKKSEPKNGKTTWSCKCDCGKEVIVRTELLRKGKTRSCGCLNIENHSGCDLTGHVFGRLTVIKQSGTNGKETIWLCQCQCGNQVRVIRSRLVTGLVRSCGCQRLEAFGKNARKNYYKGTHIGLIRRRLPRVDSGTQIQGVTLHKKSGKYMARIRVKGKAIYLGLFKTKEEAGVARDRAVEKYFKPILRDYENEQGE